MKPDSITIDAITVLDKIVDAFESEVWSTACQLAAEENSDAVHVRHVRSAAVIVTESDCASIYGAG